MPLFTAATTSLAGLQLGSTHFQGEQSSGAGHLGKEALRQTPQPSWQKTALPSLTRPTPSDSGCSGHVRRPWAQQQEEGGKAAGVGMAITNVLLAALRLFLVILLLCYPV